MNKKKYTGYIIVGAIVVIAFWMVITFNGLVKKQENLKLQWNEVQNSYQRRLDLIPNLVNVVKGGAVYEQSTLEKVIEARSKATAVVVEGDIDAAKFNQQKTAQDELAGAANRLLVSVEKYPDIVGTKAFRDLQVQLEGTERRIKVARKDFNASVATYNSSVKSFPTKLIAGILGFTAKEGFQSDEGAGKAAEIKF
ncbi:MAG: LemA family protein [Bacteroidetes bacterium]|nr:LemA family protein [Bacteroidota bacterium]